MAPVFAGGKLLGKCFCLEGEATVRTRGRPFEELFPERLKVSGHSAWISAPSLCRVSGVNLACHLGMGPMLVGRIAFFLVLVSKARLCTALFAKTTKLVGTRKRARFKPMAYCTAQRTCCHTPLPRAVFALNGIASQSQNCKERMQHQECTLTRSSCRKSASRC